jgi:tetraacyldisaccharide 4'-kinase
MVGKLIWRVIAFPLVVLYSIIVGGRNLLYNHKVLKSVKFDYPVIGVGNLSVGGSGKTPHVEYLIKLLRPHVGVGVLSRGYKRKTTGYRDVNVTDNVNTVGDEPLQLKRKFRDVFVAVSESRALGVPKLLQTHPETRVVVLDDVFQHRAVIPGLNILLTTYDEPFWKDYVLPAGRLREWRGAYKRSDLIIVTKCPETLSRSEAQAIIQKINPGDRPVFFSHLKYGQPYFLFDSKIRVQWEEGLDLILFSGIANTEKVKNHLEAHANKVFSLEFGDHHNFSKYDIGQLNKLYTNLESEKKIIITTEKDAVRLDEHLSYINKNKIPVFILPVVVDFLFNEKNKFDEYVKQFLLEFKA